MQRVSGLTALADTRAKDCLAQSIPQLLPTLANVSVANLRLLQKPICSSQSANRDSAVPASVRRVASALSDVNERKPNVKLGTYKISPCANKRRYIRMGWKLGMKWMFHGAIRTRRSRVRKTARAT